MWDWFAAEGARYLAVYQQLPLMTQWAVTVLVIAGLIVHLFTYGERAVHEAPSLFTTAGIFFTFLGIAEGLYDFNTQHIEATIPKLLEGLKTAFIASVFGVGIALSIKLRYALLGVRKSDHGYTADDATIGDLVRELAEVQRALVGDDDATVVSQLKLMRQDTNDKLEQLNRSHREFLANVADNNSKALITALEGVIRDFNTKISEQFGENFKQLNIAVGKILEWQERYRSQMQEMIVQQSAAANNMQTSAERYAAVVERAEQFSDVSEKLSGLLGTLESQRQRIQETVVSLAEVLAKASSGIPQLEAKIVQLTEQMTFGVKTHQDQITDALSEGMKAMGGAVGDVRREVLEATQAANQAINNHMSELAQKTKEQIVQLDAALEDELRKSISSLGTQLTSLSRRFVDDYMPLTQKLQEVLSLARAVQ